MRHGVVIGIGNTADAHRKEGIGADSQITRLDPIRVAGLGRKHSTVDIAGGIKNTCLRQPHENRGADHVVQLKGIAQAQVQDGDNVALSWAVLAPVGNSHHGHRRCGFKALKLDQRRDVAWLDIVVAQETPGYPHLKGCVHSWRQIGCIDSIDVKRFGREKDLVDVTRWREGALLRGIDRYRDAVDIVGLVGLTHAQVLNHNVIAAIETVFALVGDGDDRSGVRWAVVDERDLG